MAKSFGEQLEAFAAKTEQKLEDVDVAFKLSLFNRVVQNTRVADPATWQKPDPDYKGGQMRGGWQVAASATFIEGYRNTGSGLPGDEIGKIQPYEVTYLTNAVPYAPVYNEIDNIIGLAVADANRALADAVEDVT